MPAHQSAGIGGSTNASELTTNGNSNMASTRHAEVATLIRRELKKHGIPGKVRSRTASMMTAVDVYLDDQLPATVQAIREHCAQYQYGHFDGMQDLYENSNTRDDIPQVKFISINNRVSDERWKSALDYCIAHHNGFEGVSPTALICNLDWQQSGILRRLMGGEWGTWLSSQKPRATL